MWYEEIAVMLVLLLNFCTISQINHNIYSVIGLKNGQSHTAEEEEDDDEEMNGEDDEENDIAEEEK